VTSANVAIETAGPPYSLGTVSAHKPEAEYFSISANGSCRRASRKDASGRK
jgi:hypothetical protein